MVNKTTAKLQDLLGNTKDKLEENQKSGIYEVTCECGKQYVGQTARTIDTRIKEHLSKFTNRHYQDSAIAEHMHQSGHTITNHDVKLCKHVLDRRKLDFWETVVINGKDPDILLNREPGPLSSCLLKYV